MSFFIDQPRRGKWGRQRILCGSASSRGRGGVTSLSDDWRWLSLLFSFESNCHWFAWHLLALENHSLCTHIHDCLRRGKIICLAAHPLACESSTCVWVVFALAFAEGRLEQEGRRLLQCSVLKRTGCYKVELMRDVLSSLCLTTERGRERLHVCLSDEKSWCNFLCTFHGQWDHCILYLNMWKKFHSHAVWSGQELPGDL